MNVGGVIVTEANFNQNSRTWGSDATVYFERIAGRLARGMTETIAPPNRSPADELAIDAELADSFPASDPPSWTSGIAETRPRAKLRLDPDVVESTGTGPWFQSLTSLAGLLVVVWVVPLFIVGLPLALLWRAVVAATKWRAP